MTSCFLHLIKCLLHSATEKVVMKKRTIRLMHCANDHKYCGQFTRKMSSPQRCGHFTSTINSLAIYSLFHLSEKPFVFFLVLSSLPPTSLFLSLLRLQRPKLSLVVNVQTPTQSSNSPLVICIHSTLGLRSCCC